MLPPPVAQVLGLRRGASRRRLMLWGGEGMIRPALRSATDPAHFREVLSRFPTGVAVVTGMAPHGPLGMAVNSFTSVSLDPPMLLFCPAMTSSTWPLLRQAEGLAVNILAADQAHLGPQFAGPADKRFRAVDWVAGDNGAPLLLGATGWIECRVNAEQAAGDHYVVLAVSDVMALNDRVPRPLIFSCGRYLSHRD